MADRKNLLDRVSWETLGRFSNGVVDHISKWALITVPVFATAIDLLHRNTEIRLTLPLSLFLGYFSALLYFLAVSSFKFICPHDIKRYGDLRSYIDDLKARLPDVSLDKPTSAPSQGYSQNESLSSQEIENLIQAVIDEESPKVLVEFVSDKWNKDNVSRPIARALLSVLFIGALLTAFYLLAYDAPIRVYRAAT